MRKKNIYMYPFYVDLWKKKQKNRKQNMNESSL